MFNNKNVFFSYLHSSNFALGNGELYKLIFITHVHPTRNSSKSALPWIPYLYTVFSKFYGCISSFMLMLFLETCANHLLHYLNFVVSSLNLLILQELNTFFKTFYFLSFVIFRFFFLALLCTIAHILHF